VLESITTLPKLLWIPSNPITAAFFASLLTIVFVVLAFGLADGIAGLLAFTDYFFVRWQKTTIAGFPCHPLARTFGFA
jgi:hypothetical protein